MKRLRFSSRPVVALALVLCLAAVALWTARTFLFHPDPVLRPGFPVRGELAGGGSAWLRLPLREGEFLRLTVHQDGIDLIARLRDPDGEEVLASDGPNRTFGPEHLLAVAAETGEFGLELESRQPWQRGRYEAEIEALQPATERDRSLARAASLYYRGEKCRWSRSRQGKPALLKAGPLYAQALQIWIRTGEREQEALTRFRIAQVHHELKEDRLALAQLQKVLPLWRGRLEEIDVLNRIGLALRELGEHATAEKTFVKALQLARARKDRWSEAVSLNNRALLHSFWGEYQKALEGFRSAAGIWASLGEIDTEAQTMTNLGNTYYELGRPEEAVEVVERAFDLREQAGHPRETPELLRTLGIAYGDLERWDLSLKALQESWRASTQKSDQRASLRALEAIGAIRLRKGDRDGAITALGEALKLARNTGDEMWQANTLASLAEVFTVENDWRQALPRLEEAARIFEQLGATGSLPNVLYGLALARRHTGRLDEADALFARCIAGVESLRSQPASSLSRALFLADRRDYYAAYADLLLDLERKRPGRAYGERAFAVAERARARSLLEELGEAEHEIQAGIEPRLLARKLELERQMAAAGRELPGPAGAGESAPASPYELSDTVLQYEEVLAAIRTGSPRYSALTQPRPIGLAEVQRLLDPGTLMLVYLLGESRTLLWSITHETVAVHWLAPARTLEAEVEKVHGLLARAPRRLNRQRTEAALRSLGHRLLGPVAADLAGRSLVVLPDGALHYLPFGALPEPSSADAPAAGSPAPLIVHHQISYLPSASVLTLLREQEQRRASPPGDVAVLADPVFEPEDDRFARGVRRSEAPLTGPLADAARMARDVGMDGFRRLPFTGAEADSILAMARPGRVFVARGFDATREAAMSPQLARYRVVHFATHGVLDSRHPQLSGLVLSQFDPKGRQRDGFLRLYDVYNLDLPVDLVVLSACQTAVGPQVRGEGLIGLTRGFMYAGAPRVVVSLWNVNDRATAELMKRFYRGLLVERLPAAEALQRAQAQMSAHPHWSSPFYWAGFVLQGEWR